MGMQEQMVRYFAEEKTESWLFILVGVVAVGASVWLLRSGSSYRGMAYPLIAVALIQLVVGGTVAFRTDAQVAALVQQLASSPAAFQSAEVPRMEAVMRNFELYKVIEVVLLLAGVALTYAFRRKELVYGIGVGLVVQASLMLVLDLFAEKRGDAYLTALRELPTASAPVQDVQKAP
ncbi:hypothetical protein [Archangium sp.]|jgi:hypothetical protein|uniref:hypothetical protein n=1 Tax=Archangium sp. TaxID=1872627 RepID=UPI002EDA0DA7